MYSLYSVSAIIIGIVTVQLSLATYCSADEYEHGYADSSGIKIHYVTTGEGPLLVLIHGYPDYWYTWRKQIPVLAKKFKVVAIDQRGYNKSDQPKRVESYVMRKLVGDVIAILDHFEAKRATVVGHDWGAAVAWNVAFAEPERVERLVIMSVPHPSGLARELANNKAQKNNSQYARNFQKVDAAKKLSPRGLASWVQDPAVKEKYVEAFERSSIEGMLNYYKANYPGSRLHSLGKKTRSKPGRVKCPVLIFHGLQDKYLLAAGFNDNWKWIDGDTTMVMIPSAGHFVHRDATDLVNRRLESWLSEPVGEFVK